MYPVACDQRPPERRNRATICFRFLLCIPHFVVAFFYGIAALLAVPVYVIAYVVLWLEVVAIGLWFAGVIAGRTSFVEAMRIPMAYYTRANAYSYLLTEGWPPFDPGRGELGAAPQPTTLTAS